MVGFELVLWASSSWIVLKLILDNELTIQRLRRTRQGSYRRIYFSKSIKERKKDINEFRFIRENIIKNQI